MALGRPSNKQIERQEALLKSNARQITDFLSYKDNPEHLTRLMRLNAESYSVLIEKILEGDDEAAEFFFDRLDDPALLPRQLKMPASVQKFIEAEKAKKAREKRAPISAFAGAWASIMASWGFDQTQRNAIATGFWGTMLTGVAMNVFGSTAAQAALPPAPEKFDIAITERAPLELSVGGKKDNPFVALSDKFLQAKAGEIPHLKFTDDGDIKYRKWTVPDSVFKANILTEAITAIPAKLTHAIQASESSFDPFAENDDSDACGLNQFLPSTLSEKVYNYGALMGYPHAAAMVERYVEKHDSQKRPIFGFRPVDEAAAATLRELCFDPDFNTRLASVYTIRNTGAMQEDLKQYAPRGHVFYPVTTAMTYLAHMSGMKKEKQMIADLHDTGGKTIAHMFFTKKGTDDNAGILFVNGDRSQPRSVAQLHDYIAHERGLGADVMPDMRHWSKIKVAIKENVQRYSARSGPSPNG